MKYRIDPAKLVSIRESTGMNQVEASRVSGIKQPTLSSYETGRAEPPLANAYKLAKAYGMSIDELAALILIPVED